MSAKQKVWHFYRDDLQWSKVFELRAVHAIDPNWLQHLFFFLFSFVSCLSLFHSFLLTPSYKISHCFLYFSGGTNIDGKLLSQQLLMFFHALPHVYLPCQAVIELSLGTVCFCYATLRGWLGEKNRERNGRKHPHDIFNYNKRISYFIWIL